ncbi:hypothetical protein NDU88_004316 [Pleurodeles waltl]|uniref:Uncharacterized protein n=1 Tax=Pleurodeles waltl TaxID=8319 RepID=A0AAV7M9Q6_PLEWA|nr:hypothetical protein NDU88_004316 [Pleurodeles waltl]
MVAVAPAPRSLGVPPHFSPRDEPQVQACGLRAALAGHRLWGTSRIGPSPNVGEGAGRRFIESAPGRGGDIGGIRGLGLWPPCLAHLVVPPPAELATGARRLRGNRRGERGNSFPPLLFSWPYFWRTLPAFHLPLLNRRLKTAHGGRKGGRLL